MKPPLNRTALTIGAFLLGLVVLDGFIRLRGLAPTGSFFQSIAPASTVAIFLLGLTLGMVGGIVGFFAYLGRKQKQVAEEETDIDLLLQELSMEVDNPDFDFSSEDSFSAESKVEKLEPWEREADWWRGAEDSK